VKRLHIYYALSAVSEATAERALIGHPIFPNSAGKEWSQLVKTENEVHKIAFGRSIEDSLQALSSAKGGDEANHDVVVILLRSHLAEKVKEETLKLFIKTVLGTCLGQDSLKGGCSLDLYRKSVAARGELVGKVLRILFQALEDLESHSPRYPDLHELNVTGALEVARDMIIATQLYMQLFPNRLQGAKSNQVPLSPPPSPSKFWSRHNLKRKHDLRCLLGRLAFDEAIVEEARDVVVDLLTRS